MHCCLPRYLVRLKPFYLIWANHFPTKMLPHLSLLILTQSSVSKSVLLSFVKSYPVGRVKLCFTGFVTFCPFFFGYLVC